MNAIEIKPGMWLRHHHDGTAWRVVLGDLAEWAAVDVHGRGRLILDPSAWKPWEAWPGEWVRDRQGNTWRVAQLVRPPADLARAYGYAVDGTCHDEVTVVLEPALEPVAAPKRGGR